MTAPQHVIAVCGLNFEARIAAGEGVAVVYSGNQEQLAAALRQAARPADGIISFGVAGGLKPGLRPGSCIIARSILAAGEKMPTDPAWSDRLRSALPAALHGEIVSIGRPIASPAEKSELHARSSALAVDMESHIAARIARERGLPFVATRVVVDPAERAVPAAALAGHRSDGTTDPRVVAGALLRRPRDAPAVARLALDLWVARRALLRCRRQLGERFAFVNLGQHPLDVA